MIESTTNSKPTVIELAAPAGVTIEQTSTRGDGSVELGEEFARDAIDFSRVVDHLSIHTEGTVAGSQFNGDIFTAPEVVIEKTATALPASLHYDQHGRAELTLGFEGTAVGYTGVKLVSELEGLAGVQIVRGMRMPGGEPAEVEGITGAWYPETSRNPATGKFEVVTAPDGSIKNPQGKFEPEALIAHVAQGAESEALATDKITVIVQKNPETNTPTVLTIFPGENAPAFPAKIESEAFQANTLQSGPEAAYWAEHAFVQPSQ